MTGSGGRFRLRAGGSRDVPVVVAPGRPAWESMHMQTFSPEEEAASLPIKRSTGRLTRVQAEALNTWRRRLLEEKPLRGHAPWSGRPKASTSDLLAAAVEELLRVAPPDPGALWAAAQSHRASATAARTVRPDLAGERDPVYPSCTVYLAGELGQTCLDLCTAATAHAWELFEAGELERQPRRVEVADVVRLAVDRWVRGRLTPDGAARRAVAFAENYHDQPHRVHRDSAIW